MPGLMLQSLAHMLMSARPMVRPKPVASVSAGRLALYPLPASFTSLLLAMDAVLTAEEMLAIAQDSQDACAARNSLRTQAATRKRKWRFKARRWRRFDKQRSDMKAEQAKCHFFNARGFAETCDYMLHPASAGSLPCAGGQSQPKEKRNKRASIYIQRCIYTFVYIYMYKHVYMNMYMNM